MEQDKIPGDGVVTGWGTINGRLVLSSARISPCSAARCRNARQKICKIMDMAARNGAPVIGSTIPAARASRKAWIRSPVYAEVFRSNTPKSPASFRSISVIMGPCAGGAVYFARHDRLHLHGARQLLHVRDGPDVVKTVTNEIVTAEDLGGAKNP